MIILVQNQDIDNNNNNNDNNNNNSIKNDEALHFENE